MLLDVNMFVSGRSGTAQSLAGVGSGTQVVLCEDTWDAQNARDFGEGVPLALYFVCDTSITGYSGGFINFDIVGGNTISAGAISSPTRLISTEALAVTTITRGFAQILPMPFLTGHPGKLATDTSPPGLAAPTIFRYYTGRYLLGAGSTSVTTGAFRAAFVACVQDGKRFYPSGFTVI